MTSLKKNSYIKKQSENETPGKKKPRTKKKENQTFGKHAQFCLK